MNLHALIEKQIAEFDKEFPVVTIGHHHYRRERYLTRFLASSMRLAAEGIGEAIEDNLSNLNCSIEREPDWHSGVSAAIDLTEGTKRSFLEDGKITK